MAQLSVINIEADDLIRALSSREDGVHYAVDLDNGRVIEAGDEVNRQPSRYRLINPLAQQVHLLIATEYVDSLAEGYLRTHLEDALKSEAPLDEIERVLAEYPEDQREWRAYQRTAYAEEARNWIDDQGIESNLIGA